MDSVKEFYNTYQYPDINLYTKKQIKNHEKLLKKILSYANLKPEDLEGKKVLDAGCGTGDKSIFFEKNKAKVYSIDFSKKQLEKAKSYSKKFNSKNITFKQINLLNKQETKTLPKFDIIFSIGVLHHTEDAYQGFLNLVDRLEPNGIILIALYHKYSRIRYRVLRKLMHNFVSKDFTVLERWFFSSRLTKNLKKAPKNTLYDRYFIPYESYHTLREVKKWFRKNNLELINYSKNVKGIEEFKIFERKTLFFVSAKKKS